MSRKLRGIAREGFRWLYLLSEPAEWVACLFATANLAALLFNGYRGHWSSAPMNLGWVLVSTIAYMVIFSSKPKLLALMDKCDPERLSDV